MLDIKKIRENGKQLDEALANRKHEASSSLIIDLDRKNRDLIGELQGLQEERNAKSKLIGEHASNGKKDEAEAIFPSELLDDLTLVGTKEEIKEKFNVWKNSNVTELSIGLPVDLETIKYLNTLNEMY